MGEDNQADHMAPVPQCRAAQVAGALGYASNDQGFRLTLGSIANIAQEEADYLNGAMDRMQREVRRERGEMDVVKQKAIALDQLVSKLGLPKLGDPRQVPGVLDHIEWLKNEANGYARAQDLSNKRFITLQRAAGRGAEEISCGNWDALTDYVKSLVPNEDK